MSPHLKVSLSSFDNLVDSLLETRQFAERWARHWLDIARFAETTGRDVNVTMPEALQRIDESKQPSVNCDLKQEASTYGNAQP